MGSEADGRSLLIGSITHPASRFNVDGAAGSFVTALADAATSFGLPASALVSDRNDYDAGRWPLSRTQLVESGWYQARLEYRWRRYLGAGTVDAVTAAQDATLLALTGGRRTFEAAAGAFWKDSDRRYGRIAGRRLINIDLSHLRVLDQAVQQNSSWVLVLEDDAWAPSIEIAAHAVAALIARIDSSDIQFASLSTSLSHEQLGVTGLLHEQDSLELADGRQLMLLRADRPVTNTVCATLYRTTFAAEVASRIMARGLIPVVPIDWRLNEALLDMWSDGTVGPESCIWVEPGIFLQRSMHSAATS